MSGQLLCMVQSFFVSEGTLQYGLLLTLLCGSQQRPDRLWTLRQNQGHTVTVSVKILISEGGLKRGKNLGIWTVYFCVLCFNGASEHP